MQRLVLDAQVVARDRILDHRLLHHDVLAVVAPRGLVLCHRGKALRAVVELVQSDGHVDAGLGRDCAHVAARAFVFRLACLEDAHLHLVRERADLFRVCCVAAGAHCERLLAIEYPHLLVVRDDLPSELRNLVEVDGPVGGLRCDPARDELSIHLEVMARANLDVPLARRHWIDRKGFDHRVDTSALVENEQPGARVIARVGAEHHREGRRVDGHLVVGAVALQDDSVVAQPPLHGRRRTLGGSGLANAYARPFAAAVRKPRVHSDEGRAGLIMVAPIQAQENVAVGLQAVMLQPMLRTEVPRIGEYHTLGEGRPLVSREAHTPNDLAARERAKLSHLCLGQRRDVAIRELKARLEAVEHENDAARRHVLMTRGRQVVLPTERRLRFVAVEFDFLHRRAALFGESFEQVGRKRLAIHDLIGQVLNLLLQAARQGDELRPRDRRFGTLRRARLLYDRGELASFARRGWGGRWGRPFRRRGWGGWRRCPFRRRGECGCRDSHGGRTLCWWRRWCPFARRG